jgi:DNA ligase-associated metallophosphoesterase
MHGFKPEHASISDHATHHLSLCGKALVLDMSGALYWPGQRTLIVADLHLEKASALAARGQMLPPYDTHDTLLRLAGIVDRLDPQRVIALGDSFHDNGGAKRLRAEDRQSLAILQEDRDWIWVAGNHDPRLAADLGGSIVPRLELGGLTFVHVPARSRVTHEIAGHLHPAARLSIYGTAIRRPCFVGNAWRLILPAFGTFTGGLNVLDEAFAPLFGNDGMHVWMLGQEGVYPVAARQLRGD